jgi:hypothetical protein
MLGGCNKPVALACAALIVFLLDSRLGAHLPGVSFYVAAYRRHNGASY